MPAPLVSFIGISALKYRLTRAQCTSPPSYGRDFLPVRAHNKSWCRIQVKGRKQRNCPGIRDGGISLTWSRLQDV